MEKDLAVDRIQWGGQQILYGQTVGQAAIAVPQIIQLIRTSSIRWFGGLVESLV